MALFLVTCLIDEGIYSTRFVVVEAESELEVATHMLGAPARWEKFLRYAFPHEWRNRNADYGSLWDCAHDPNMTPERFLEMISWTRVDGDSEYQLAIHPVKIHELSEVNLIED